GLRADGEIAALLRRPDEVVFGLRVVLRLEVLRAGRAHARRLDPDELSAHTRESGYRRNRCDRIECVHVATGRIRGAGKAVAATAVATGETRRHTDNQPRQFDGYDERSKLHGSSLSPIGGFF